MECWAACRIAAHRVLRGDTILHALHGLHVNARLRRVLALSSHVLIGRVLPLSKALLQLDLNVTQGIWNMHHEGMSAMMPHLTASGLSSIRSLTELLLQRSDLFLLLTNAVLQLLQLGRLMRQLLTCEFQLRFAQQVRTTLA